MGHAHSSTSTNTTVSEPNDRTKENVEKLFRQNNRTNRSRSLDNRQEKLPTRAVGTSHSARFPKSRHLPRKSHDGPNGSISGLTREDKRKIETCWFKCTQKQLKKSSIDIFYDILHTEEDLLRIFRLDHVNIHKLKDNPYFKSHASNLALVLNLVVTNLQENFEQAQDALQALGYQHMHLIDRHRFQSMYWDIFTDCFERNPPPSFRKGAEREVWSRMILFIMSQMKTGYQQAINEQRSEQRLSVPFVM